MSWEQGPWVFDCESSLGAVADFPEGGYDFVRVRILDGVVVALRNLYQPDGLFVTFRKLSAHGHGAGECD